MDAKKWSIYFLTFFSYACFHSIRSAWAGLKNMLIDTPFNYTEHFLGLIDMTVVLVLAVTLTTLGHNVQKYGPKRCLIVGMLGLIGLTTAIGVLLLQGFEQKWVYLLLFGGGVGVLSSVGWPTCLYILSQRFDRKNNTALPIWSGTSQFGDFLALFISDMIIQNIHANGAITLLIIPSIMIVLVVLNYYYLPKEQKKQEQVIIKDVAQLNQQNQSHQQNVKSDKIPQIVKEIITKKSDIIQSIKDEMVMGQKGTKASELENIQQNNRPVNFRNVWCLPGVAIYVLASSIVKSINSIIMTWLVFYLSTPNMDMKEQSRIIAILWTFGVFGGGIIGGIINKKYEKKIFIMSLMIAAIAFLTLERMHQKIYQIQIIIAIVICSLAYGGPYSMLGTAIPIILGPGAKTSIISLMQGFPLAVCAFSILLVPSVGVQNIHWVLLSYCLAASIILAFAIFLQHSQSNKLPSKSTSERDSTQQC